MMHRVDGGDSSNGEAYHAPEDCRLGFACWNETPQTPPWADGDMPDVHNYLPSEQFVAGAISTRPPFDKYHPAWALPHARQALDALSEWEPDGGQTTVHIDGPTDG